MTPRPTSPRIRRRTVAYLAAVTSLGLVALSAAAAPAALAADVTVEMRAGNLFGPSTVTIQVGDTITWDNVDSAIPHTATANDGSFDSGTVIAGGSYSRTFTSPGTIAYRCIFHPPGMIGTIVVEAAPTAPPTPSPTPASTAQPGATATPGGGAGGATAAPTLPTSSTGSPASGSGGAASPLLVMAAGFAAVVALAGGMAVFGRRRDGVA